MFLRRITPEFDYSEENISINDKFWNSIVLRRIFLRRIILEFDYSEEDKSEEDISEEDNYQI